MLKNPSIMHFTSKSSHTPEVSCCRTDPNMLCGLITLCDSRITARRRGRCTRCCVLTPLKVMFVVGKPFRGVSVTEEPKWSPTVPLCAVPARCALTDSTIKQSLAPRLKARLLRVITDCSIFGAFVRKRAPK